MGLRRRAHSEHSWKAKESHAIEDFELLLLQRVATLSRLWLHWLDEDEFEICFRCAAMQSLEGKLEFLDGRAELGNYRNYRDVANYRAADSPLARKNRILEFTAQKHA